ncbi:hypothetical protein PAXRUDRAFT_90058, partial [Paxillus rubicundulus Ve08.2h10]
LANWATDPKEVKRRFVNNPACPEFPDSEWNNIILGKSVNLDVGDLEILCGIYSAPSKNVLTGQDWHVAWVRTARAYRFAFPHRASELERYGEYITQKFAHHEQRFHGRVIEFDKSVRKRVSSSRQYEFTDPHTDLFESHFLPSGKQFSE